MTPVIKKHVDQLDERGVVRLGSIPPASRRDRLILIASESSVRHLIEPDCNSPRPSAASKAGKKHPEQRNHSRDHADLPQDDEFDDEDHNTTPVRITTFRPAAINPSSVR